MSLTFNEIDGQASLDGATKQHLYRERQKASKRARRLNAWLDVRSLVVLDHLSKAHNLTKKEVLEALLIYFENDLLFSEKLAQMGRKPKQLRGVK